MSPVTYIIGCLLWLVFGAVVGCVVGAVVALVALAVVFNHKEKYLGSYEKFEELREYCRQYDK